MTRPFFAFSCSTNLLFLRVKFEVLVSLFEKVGIFISSSCSASSLDFRLCEGGKHVAPSIASREHGLDTAYTPEPELD